MSPDLDSLALRVCGALGNGTLHGLLVAACVLVSLRLLRRTSAATRYAVAFAGLLTLAVLPAIHFIAPSALRATDLSSLRTWMTSRTQAPDSPRAGADAPVDRHDGTFDRHRLETTTFRETAPGVSHRHPEAFALRSATPPSLAGLPNRQRAAASPRSHTPRSSYEVQAEPVNTSDLLLPPSVPFPGSVPTPIRTTEEILEDENDSETTQGVEDGAATTPAIVSDPRISLSPRYALLALALWGILAASRLAGLGKQCWTLQRLKRTASPVSPDVEKSFDDLRLAMGIHRSVRLGASPDLRSPIAVGFLRPAILLPEPLLALNTGELEPLLRHELAHIRRRDDWTNLLQQCLKAVFFFHPGVLALSRRLNLDREIACDDHVLSALNQPRRYALYLTDFASRTRGRQFAAAPAAWSNPTQLQERIRMILDPQRNPSPRVAPTRAGVLTLAALLIAAATLVALPRLALAAPEDIPANRSSNGNADSATGITLTTASSGATATLEASDDSDATPVKPKPARNSARTSSIHVEVSTEALPTPATVTLPPATRQTLVLTAPPPPTPVATPTPTTVPDAVARNVEAAPQPPPSPSQIPIHPHQPGTGNPRLEERMRRLEHLVESLVHKQTAEAPKAPKPNGKSPDVLLRAPRPDGDGPSVAWAVPRSDIEESHFAWISPKVDAGQLRHLDERSRELANISKEVERSLRDAERATRQSLKSAGVTQEKALVFEWARPEEARRKMIERHRADLQQQIEAMQQTIERLELELDRFNDVVEETTEIETEAANLENHLRSQRAQAEKARELAEDAARKARAKIKAKAGEPPPAPSGSPEPEIR